MVPSSNPKKDSASKQKRPIHTQVLKQVPKNITRTETDTATDAATRADSDFKRGDADESGNESGNESDSRLGSNSHEHVVESSSAGGKHRLRISKACDLCRKKKTKCNGLAPCSNCIKSGLDCIYDMTVPKRKQRPAPKLASVKKSATTTKGIIKEMDNKINRLEFLLQTMINNMNGGSRIANAASNMAASVSTSSSLPNGDSVPRTNNIFSGYLKPNADDSIIIPTGILNHDLSDSDLSDSDSRTLSDDDDAPRNKIRKIDYGNNHDEKKDIAGHSPVKVKSEAANSEIEELPDGDVMIDEDDDENHADSIGTTNHPVTSNMEIVSSKLSPLVLSQKCFKWAGEKIFKLSKSGSDAYMLRYSFQKSVFAFKNHFKKQLTMTKEFNQVVPINPFDLFPDNVLIKKFIVVFSKVEMFQTFLDPNDLKIIAEKFYQSRSANSKKKLTSAEYLILTMVCTFATYLIGVQEATMLNNVKVNKAEKKSADIDKEDNKKNGDSEDSDPSKKSNAIPPKAENMKRYEQMFFKFALTLYHKISISTGSIDCVKGILLIALYFEGCSLSVNYSIISSGVRICEELNLHLSDTYKHLDNYEMLKRKMIWLIFYVLDKNACMLTLKPPSIVEKYSTTLNDEDFKFEMIKNFSIDSNNRHFFVEKSIDFYLKNDYEFMKEFNKYCLSNEYGFRYLSMFSRMKIAGIEQKMYDVLLSPTSTIKILLKKTMNNDLQKEVKLKLFKKIQEKFDYLNKKLDDIESLLSIYGSHDSNGQEDICKITHSYPCSSKATLEYRKCALMTFYYWYHSNRMNLNRFGSTLMWSIEERRYHFSELAIDSALVVLKLCTRYYDLFLVLKNCFTLYILSSFFTIVTHVFNLIYIESKKKNPSPDEGEKIIQYIVQLILTESNYFETIDYVEDTFKDHIRYWTCRMIIICLLLLEDDDDINDGHIKLDSVLKNVSNKENYKGILQKFLNDNEFFCENYVSNILEKVRNKKARSVAKNQEQSREQQKSQKSGTIETDKFDEQQSQKLEVQNQDQVQNQASQSIQPSIVSAPYQNSYEYMPQKRVQVQVPQQPNYHPQSIMNQAQHQQRLQQELQQQQMQMQQQLHQMQQQVIPINGQQQQMFGINPLNGYLQPMFGMLPMQQQRNIPQHTQFNNENGPNETKDNTIGINTTGINTTSIPYSNVYLPNNNNRGGSVPVNPQPMQNTQQLFAHNMERAQVAQPPQNSNNNAAFMFNNSPMNISPHNSDTPHSDELSVGGDKNNAFEASMFTDQFTTLVHGAPDDFGIGNQDYYFYYMNADAGSGGGADMANAHEHINNNNS